ncbi:MAG: TIGR03943 family protein [Anaerolineales bacterium]|jgi:uncharacterized repeat protein (TIGR03943 family)
MDSFNRYLKAAVLFGLGMLLLVKIMDDSLYFYINKRFAWLTTFGAICFLTLAFASLRNREPNHAHEHHTHEHSHRLQLGMILIASVPLLLGFLLPAKPLDTSVIQNRGISYTASFTTQDDEVLDLDQPAEERTILDWIRSFNYSENPSEFQGEPANVIGFVYHDPRLKENQFMVGRIAITCCVADAFAIGMIVEWPDAVEMTENSWVNVEGIVDATQLDGKTIPLIIAESITPTNAPSEPYVYP